MSVVYTVRAQYLHALITRRHGVNVCVCMRATCACVSFFIVFYYYRGWIMIFEHKKIINRQYFVNNIKYFKL